VNPDGTLKWSFTIDYHSAGSPAIGADGTLYIAAGMSGLGSKLCAFKYSEPLPPMNLTVVGSEGAAQTLNETGIGDMSTYSGVGGCFKVSPRIPQWYANYTGVPLTTLCSLVGDVTENTFVQVIASDGFNCNFSYTQVVDGIVNVPSCAYNYNLTTVDLTDTEVPQTQPITMMLAYQFVNGTFLPSNGPLFLTFVGPEGLLVVPSPDLAGGKAWVKNVTNVSIWWIGDFDCTHAVDYSDIIYFVDAYIASYGASPVLNQRCDFNLDANINYDDIISFVDCYIAANTP
jgi:hypothetical protein